MKTVRISTEEAIQYFGGKGKGGVNALAKCAGVTHGAVSQWGEHVPGDTAYKLYVRTEGEIPAEVTESHKAA
tara:strand:- start:242 stop:457 length:216 start_codon:yes stop_codon:yes gene_type:complete